jgi:hypothetical protein
MWWCLGAGAGVAEIRPLFLLPAQVTYTPTCSVCDARMSKNSKKNLNIIIICIALHCIPTDYYPVELFYTL